MKMTEKSWKANWDEKYSWCSIPLSDLKINKKEELLKDGWKVYLENNGEVYWQNLSIEQYLIRMVKIVRQDKEILEGRVHVI